MQFGAVALVLVETIFGKLRAEVTHDSIPRHFRNHARSRDGETIAIAVDDCGLRKWTRKNREPVDQYVLRRRNECRERNPHCFMRRAQNVDPIDLQMIDNADAPGDFAVCNQLVVDLVAAFRRKLFRIVQLPMPKLFRQDNCRGDDRTSQRATARFINSGDANDSGRA